jgi:alpha-glucosidase
MRTGAALMLGLLPLTSLVGSSFDPVPQGDHQVSSPSGNITVTISVGDVLTYSVAWRGRLLLEAAPISLTLGDGTVVGASAEVVDARSSEENEVITPVVPTRFSDVVDHYKELSLDFSNGWGLDVRAYDDGVAYRFRTSVAGPVTVRSEEFNAVFDGDPMVWFPTEESFLTHSERLYAHLRLSEIVPDSMASMPVLVAVENGPKVAITEADLRDYPGLYLTRSADGGLNGIFPAFPAAEEQMNDRTVRVTAREDFIAKTEGDRTFPWRVFAIAEDDGDLIENTLVYRLAPPLQMDDVSWIRPGKVAWDWWNANNIYGVDFAAGINTDTYRYYIDFAAANGIEYIVLDEGWSDPADLTKVNPDIDLPALLEHGRDKNVGLILWVVWKTLDDRLEESLDDFAEWGVKGIKVDFMQRDDQPMVNYYWKVAKAAADRHLLVDFHGAYKPTGLRRAFPNVLTREGVRGLEWSKWSEYPTPEHNVTLPFTRMLAGPMDYTPGAMINAQERQFHPVFDRPMSMGTRVHQMAMYVVYESPLQMLADSPSNYLRERECLDFLSAVPTVWDETRALSARVGDWVAVARRHGDAWYVGAMTDWTARELELNLSFLDAGTWNATIYRDGVNAARAAIDYKKIERTVTATDVLTVRLAPGGGWVARLERTN